MRLAGLPYWRLGLVIMAIALSGCAILRTGFESPQIKVSGLHLLAPASGELAPRLAVALRVSNPNDTELSIAGMSYSIALAGFDVLSGVSAHVPTLKPYSETPITLVLSANMVQMLRIAHQLAKRGWGHDIHYAFTAKLDLGHWQPAIKIHETGRVSLKSSPPLDH